MSNSHVILNIVKLIDEIAQNIKLGFAQIPVEVDGRGVTTLLQRATWLCLSLLKLADFES